MMAKSMNDYETAFPKVDDEKSIDVKYNLFRFQDHLNHQIQLVSIFFLTKDYNSAFESLQTIFTDTCGFFTSDELGILKPKYAQAMNSVLRLQQYNQHYTSCINSNKKLSYTPQSKIYFDMLEFRMELMRLLAKHQFLIPTIKKGIGAATTL